MNNKKEKAGVIAVGVFWIVSVVLSLVSTVFVLWLAWLLVEWVTKK